MIARMVYVMCDGCGNPSEMADDAREAREQAKAVDGFVRRGGRDLCRLCAAKEADHGA